MALVWHLSVIQNSKFNIVSGVILGSNNVLKTGIKSPFSIPRTYFIKTYANRKIFVLQNDKETEAITNKYGAFKIKISAANSSEIQILDGEKNSIQTQQEYPVFFNQKQHGPLVISDIDDTIMRSYTKTKIKRLLITLFTAASKRKVISYTQQLYENIGKDADFFYVSKSENNLFYLISNFILHHQLPIGPLLLTPFLSTSQLVFEKKNSNFKFENICSILDHFNNKKVILIGDDTQSDMSIYREVIEHYGKRIKKVYIRQTKPHKSKNQEYAWNQLKETGVKAYYFKHDEFLITESNT